MTKEEALLLLDHEVYTFDSNFRIFKVVIDRALKKNNEYMWVYDASLTTLDEIDAAEYPENVANLFLNLEECKEYVLSLIDQEVQTLFKAKDYIKDLSNI